MLNSSTLRNLTLEEKVHYGFLPALDSQEQTEVIEAADILENGDDNLYALEELIRDLYEELEGAERTKLYKPITKILKAAEAKLNENV